MRKTSMIGMALGAGAVTAAVLGLVSPQPSLSQTDRSADAATAFDQVASVMLSPRCHNCHTLTNFPRQSDDRHPHLFQVTRGEDRGAPGLPCSTCHGRTNNAASGVPGADEEWRLAPRAMGWDGLSISALCRQLKDPQHNGHRSGDQIIDHLRTRLVMWAWSPGTDRRGRSRTPPPVPYDDFMRAAETWVHNGAPCP